jgi:hypothetical protein
MGVKLSLSHKEKNMFWEQSAEEKEKTGEWGKLRNEELHNLYASIQGVRDWLGM